MSIICRLETEDERRDVRARFFKDPVFVIAHAVLRKRECALFPEEVFCTAEKFVDFLLKIDVTETELIHTEIDILDECCKDEELFFQVLIVSIMKLSALRKVNPVAGCLVRMLLPRFCKHKDCLPMLENLDRIEQKRIVDQGRVDLLKYELITISKEQCSVEDGFGKFIKAVLECDYEVIKSVHTAISIFNAQEGNKYEKYGEMLLQEYLVKHNQENARNKKVIVDYVMKLHPSCISMVWQGCYHALWNEILDIAEVENSIYNLGKQKNTTFNRNLVGNILHLMIEKGIITENPPTLAIILEGNRESSIQKEMRFDPKSKGIKIEVNNLIESHRKKIGSCSKSMT